MNSMTLDQHGHPVIGLHLMEVGVQMVNRNSQPFYRVACSFYHAALGEVITQAFLMDTPEDAADLAKDIIPFISLRVTAQSQSGAVFFYRFEDGNSVELVAQPR